MSEIKLLKRSVYRLVSLKCQLSRTTYLLSRNIRNESKRKLLESKERVFKNEYENTLKNIRKDLNSNLMLKITVQDNPHILDGMFDAIFGI